MTRDLNRGGRCAFRIGRCQTLVTMCIGDERLIAAFFERI